MSFTCFFSIKQNISIFSTSLFEIHFCYSVLFHILFILNLMMISGVCIFQVTKFCGVVPEYGVYFMLQFWQKNCEISSRFLENLCTHVLYKEKHSPLSAILLPAAPSGLSSVVSLGFPK